MTNFDQGLILGLTMPWFGSAVENTRIEANMYLYGEYECPPLPNWDKEQYPYICYAPFAGWINGGLWVSSTPLVIVDGQLYDRYGDDHTLLFAKLFSDRTGWDDFKEWSGLSNDYAIPVWSNHDILNEDGTVYLKATNLVPAPEHIMVAYEYNGYILPALPTYDKSKYPCVYITNAGSIYEDEFVLRLTSQPLNVTVDETTGEPEGIQIHDKVLYREYILGVDRAVWLLNAEYKTAFGHTYKPLWSNVDMPGTVYHYVSGGTSYYQPTGTIGFKASEAPILRTDVTQLYSYNGILLPKLPEYDTTAYPYAGIVADYDENGEMYAYIVCLSASAFYFESSSGRAFGGDSNNEIPALNFNKYPEWQIWYEKIEFVTDSLPLNYWLIWTNFDVLNADGTIFLAKSDPIQIK